MTPWAGLENPGASGAFLVKPGPLAKLGQAVGGGVAEAASEHQTWAKPGIS